MLIDGFAVAGSWLVVRASTAEPGSDVLATLFGLAVVVAATMAALAFEHLYTRRNTNARSEELVRLARVSVLSAAAAVVTGWLVGEPPPTSAVIAGFFAVFTGLAVARGWFARWLRQERAVGRHTQPVLIVGDGEEAEGLANLLRECPEVGFRAVGFAADLTVDDGLDPLDADPGATVVELARRTGATGVLIASRSCDLGRLNRGIRQLHAAGIHVHLSSGIACMHRRRLDVQAIAHEPLLYIAPPSFSRTQLVAKRALDVVVASVLLAVFAPVLVAAAAAVKLDDRGPVLFRQRRVGRNGELFEVLKLRTMVVGADERLGEVLDLNQRTGPLFKAALDPRVTRCGRFLRESSIDEVPQLLNVLRGEMSMVGPRPALPEEAEHFDEDLLDRFLVKPGLSGLWQVEARHKPSFDQYRRLDLFYVENWSLALDVAVLLATVPDVLRRGRAALSGDARAAAEMPITSLPAERLS